MTLQEKIFTIYPELNKNYTDFDPTRPYKLQDDSDGRGPYIKEWNYHKPQPTQEQLDALND